MSDVFITEGFIFSLLYHRHIKKTYIMRSALRRKGLLKIQIKLLISLKFWIFEVLLFIVINLMSKFIQENVIN